MCGRYLFSNGTHVALQKIKHHYQKHLPLELFNQISFEEVYPSQKTVVFLFNEETQQLSSTIMKWGISTHRKHIINLRSEHSPAQRYKPCLIIASGYYEWNKISKKKYFFTTKNNIVFMAGCYNNHHEFAILTEEAYPHLRSMHSRTPFSIKKEDADDFLKNKPVPSNQSKINVSN